MEFNLLISRLAGRNTFAKWIIIKIEEIINIIIKGCFIKIPIGEANELKTYPINTANTHGNYESITLMSVPNLVNIYPILFYSKN